MMKVTIELDEDVLQMVHRLALEKNREIGKVLSELICEALSPALKSREGFPVIPERKRRITTNTLINLLREDEGI